MARMALTTQGHSPEHPLRFRVDLARCLTPAAFVRTLRDEFAVPPGCESVAQIDDWMRDLGWLGVGYIAIELCNEAAALRRNPAGHRWAMDRFQMYRDHFARQPRLASGELPLVLELVRQVGGQYQVIAAQEI